MKRFAMVGGICASLLLGVALSAVAQDEHPSERPPNAPQEPKETRPQPKAPQDQAKPEEPSKPGDRKNQEPESGDRKNTTPQSEGRQPQEPQSGDRKMPGREESDKGKGAQGHPADQHGQFQGQQRHIPDKDFHAHFGQSHHFAVGHIQQYQGRPSFAYSSYTFVLVDTWPTGWGYDADNYYVDYMDGEYWLFNVLYPGVRVELIVVE
jgi:hypothetical protein